MMEQEIGVNLCNRKYDSCRVSNARFVPFLLGVVKSFFATARGKPMAGLFDDEEFEEKILTLLIQRVITA